MRWLLPLALVVCACGGGSDTGEGGSCAEGPTIFRGERYRWVANAGDARPAGRIGTLVRAGCNDGGPHEGDRRVAVQRIRGVDPHKAIIVGGAVYENVSD